MRRGGELARGAGGSIPATWMVLAAILSVQSGAGVAKTIFDELPPSAVVWLRFLTGAVVLLLVIRPALRGRTWADWRIVTAFGIALVSMNWAIYEAIARIPLGVAVTIEFLGPLVVAVAGSRRPLDLVWVGLAATGVVLLSWDDGDVTLAGVGFALLAAGSWACYILLSAATGRRFSGSSGLAIAMVVGVVMVGPAAVSQAGTALLDPRLLAIGVTVGILSTIVPYSLEMHALRRIRPSVFSILMSLQPAAAAVIGMLLLAEFLSPVQWFAMVCVVVASAGATRTGRRAEPEA
ncbi:EamA family transporter [Spiractinospora alimapuensis]|uniref:EamA family transporter n=1 Tax=Spiractinospora alimapuensis TaxID=2820884 RepID=UPI001F42F9BD|nr:EamA family transporter [Spiractinospora alimapuensis]